MMVDTELIKDFADNVINDILDCLRSVVKGSHRGQNRSTYFSKVRHEAKMPQMERSLPENNNEFSFFLERHIPSPYQEIRVE